MTDLCSDLRAYPPVSLHPTMSQDKYHLYWRDEILMPAYNVHYEYEAAENGFLMRLDSSNNTESPTKALVWGEVDRALNDWMRPLLRLWNRYVSQT